MMTTTIQAGQPYDVYAKLEDPMGVLSVALGQWEDRDDTRPQPEVRRAANTAMDTIDAMVRELYQMRSRLLTEVRGRDGAAAARVEPLPRAAEGGAAAGTGRRGQAAGLGGRDDEGRAGRDGADESVGLQDLDCLLDGAPGYPVGPHEGLPARQRGTRRYLPGHDPLPQHVRELTVKRHVRVHVQGHGNHPRHPR